jgi:hypothetical protein
MLKKVLVLAGVVVGLVLLLLYVSGSGWLAREVSAGTPTEITRPAADMDSRFAHQRETARDLGVAASREPQKQILFGDFHVHTSFSPDAFTQGMPLTGGTGSHTISDACDFARFCSNLDFWSVNDHAEGSTPRRWKETIEAIGRCDAVFDPEDPGVERDLISFVGWEWSHMGTTAENHFGHRNVILRDLDPEQLPTRPIASDSPARYFPETSTLLLGLMPFLAGDLDYLRYANYQQETAAVERCPSGVPVRDLPDDCREYAATPGELLERLDEWGFESLVIPHGTIYASGLELCEATSFRLDRSSASASGRGLFGTWEYRALPRLARNRAGGGRGTHLPDAL